MKITVLVENHIDTASEQAKELKSVHGLSLYIEWAEKRILFDVGPDRTFAENADILGIDLAEVDLVIISHGHLDHGGGLEHFFSLNSKAQIFLHSQAVVNSHYSRRGDGIAIPIGLDQSLMERNRERITLIEESMVIVPGLTVYENIPEDFARPVTNSNLYCKKGDAIVPDDFRHEIVLSLEEGDKNFIMTGCSHSGIINMVKKVKQDKPDLETAAVFGGFHLYSPGKNLNVSPEYLRALILEMDRFHTTFYTGHCTGEVNYQSIKKQLGQRLSAMNAGLSLEL